MQKYRLQIFHCVRQFWTPLQFSLASKKRALGQGRRNGDSMGGGGRQSPPPDFDRSISSIPAAWAVYAHQITTCLGPLDFQTFLRSCWKVKKRCHSVAGVVVNLGQLVK